MFNYHLVKLTRSGLLSKMERKWLTVQGQQEESQNSIGFSVLDYDNLFFPFAIIAVGAMVSLVTAFLERALAVQT